MAEKEKVILRHSQLALEYSKLANSDHTMSIEEWDKINTKMAEIIKEIEELKVIESEWKEMKKRSNPNAKEVTTTLGASYA